MISVNNKWGTLREVILGRSYYPEFYQNIKNSNIKSCLCRIAEETEEDYEFFEKTLKSQGVIVHRPTLDINDRIENYVDQDKKIITSFQIKNNKLENTCETPAKFVTNTLIPKPPMTPRDSWVIVGQDIIMSSPDHPATVDLVQKIVDNKNTVWKESYQLFESEFSGGNLFQVGVDMFLGEETISLESKQIIEKMYSNYNWHYLDVEGHNDGYYHLLKPGVMISLNEISKYQHNFPGWDILYIPDQSWEKVTPFLQLKHKNQGRWWLPGEEQNREFTHFVKSWLNNWVGYVEETVFDVNCLMYDSHYVFVNNYNKQVFDFLKKHRIEPIIIPFRHRYFWDGGLHCITLEINRDGNIENYFK